MFPGEGPKLSWNQCWALLIISSQCLLFTGLVYGWSSLQIMLRSEGVYECNKETDEDDDDETCPRQTIQFSLVFTIGQFAFGIAGPFVGLLLDDPRFGVVFVGNLGCSLVGIGLLLIANLPNTSSGDDMIIPGMALIGAAGPTVFYPMLRRADAFAGYEGHVITLLNALFDGSAALFAVLLIFYEAGVSRQVILGVFGSCAFCFVPTNSLVSYLATSPESVVVSTKQDSLKEQPEKTTNSEIDKLEEVRTSEEEVAVPHLHSLPVFDMLMTREFLYILCFASVSVLHSNTYLGFVGDALLYHTSEHRMEQLVQMFSFMLPAGVFTTPLVGAVIQRGPWFSLLVTNISGIVHILMSILLPVSLQPITFAIFVIFRTFLYSSLVAAVASIFGYRKLGSLLGVLFAVSAAFALLQYPLASWTVRSNNGDWMWAFLLIGLLHLPLFLLTTKGCPNECARISPQVVRTDQREMERELTGGATETPI